MSQSPPHTRTPRERCKASREAIACQNPFERRSQFEHNAQTHSGIRYLVRKRTNKQCSPLHYVVHMPRLLRLAASLLVILAPAFAATDWKSLKPEGYVSDFAHVVDPQSRAELEDYAARVEQGTGAQLAFVTLSSLQGEPIEDVTNDLFHAWAIGQKKEDNGAMVLLSVGDHK